MIRRQLLIAAACLSAVGAAKAFTIPGVGGGDKSGQAGAGVTDVDAAGVAGEGILHGMGVVAFGEVVEGDVAVGEGVEDQCPVG